MAKVYLLSGGDTFSLEVQELLQKDLKGKCNLVSVGAGKKYEENDAYFYGNQTFSGVQADFKFSDIKNFNLIDNRTSKEEGLELLKNADIIYLQGGDPFVQLEYLQNNGYDEFLKKYNGILLGVSAGTMNLSKLAFYSKDEDYPETTFYNALGITDLTIDPHFDINDKDRINEIIKWSKKHEIIGLPDYSAIIIEQDGSIKNIGNFYAYENGKLKYF